MIAYRTTQRLADAVRAFQVVRDLDAYYPDFVDWWFNKAVPGVVTGSDGLLLAEEHGQIVGVALWKKAENEAKLRCVRVVPQVAGRGLGIHLIDRALKSLGCDKPVVTVSEEKMHDYARIFVNRFDFDLSRVEKGLYRQGKLEYIFNGPLASTTSY
jgi:hypothetical protein